MTLSKGNREANCLNLILREGKPKAKCLKLTLPKGTFVNTCLNLTLRYKLLFTLASPFASGRHFLGGFLADSFWGCTIGAHQENAGIFL